MVSKNKFLISQILIVLGSLTLFLILNQIYLYHFSEDFQEYLKVVSPSATSANFTGEMLPVWSIISLGNNSLILLLIFPLFIVVGSLISISFTFKKRIDVLDNELKEIKNKLNV